MVYVKSIVKELVAALEKHGNCQEWCTFHAKDGTPCKCGYRDALSNGYRLLSDLGKET